MSEKQLLDEAAFELRNYEFNDLAAAVQRAADEADAADDCVRVPRAVLEHWWVTLSYTEREVLDAINDLLKAADDGTC